MIKSLSAAALLMMVCSPAALAESADGSPWSLNFSLNAADFEGFAQTPMGGGPGTSDIERPTLDELNMDDQLFYRLEAAWHGGFGTVYAGADWINFTGSGTLDDPLTTRKPFAAGTAFDSELTFNWYRVGYARAFRKESGTWVAPLADLAFLDFDYRFEAAGETITRSYMKPALRLGVAGRIAVSEPFGISLSAAASLPFSNTPQIAEGRATADLRVWEGAEGQSVELFAGLGFLYIDYEDNQELPNHLRLEGLPTVTAGLKTRF